MSRGIIKKINKDYYLRRTETKGFWYIYDKV